MAEMRAVLLLLLCVSHSSANCGIQKAYIPDTLEDNLVHRKMFPWVVSLHDSYYTQLALGCILSEFWILSTASTFQHRNSAVVIVGIANMDVRKRAFKEYAINTIIIHKDFDNSSMNNNIALLKTDSTMKFNDLVQPICFLGRRLQKPLEVLRNCWVSGWNPTSATETQLTMSVLRKISVKDVDLCPLNRPWKTACSIHFHREQKTYNICLGDPGNPMMCQLPKSDLWVLRGVLTQGNNKCSGPFLYTKVEDYSDWIKEESEKVGPALYPLSNWEKMPPHSSGLRDLMTQRSQAQNSSAKGHQEQRRGTSRPPSHLGTAKEPGSSPHSRQKGLRETGRVSEIAMQPMYYDYYSGEAGEGESVAGQNSLHQPQQTTVLFSLLAFFCSS
ncbi:PREDICTED: inactive serine protease 54 [Elephantulus edwardii]|uniref:inactive serine protease 54 n=1 Tax=Elephantulus edwardii TaxID=28737 RepID=UPI0003F0684F|nr:PREDICTED: inactive serine protease 54 [Elephantulus edwardii]